MVAVWHLPDTFVLDRRSATVDLMEAVVDHWEAHLRQRLKDAQPRPLGLATGRTMVPFYAALVRRLQAWPDAEQDQLSRGWLSFNLDEYCLLYTSDAADE